MPGESADAPKIIIDSDWKSQAQAEKERLSKKAEAPKAAGGLAGGIAGAAGGAAAGASAAGEAGAGEPGEAGSEQPRFEDIISLLMTQALTYLGAFPDPRSGRPVVSLELAKVFVDLLGILEEKTKGNLSEQEKQVLSRVLGELRMEYVEISKYVQQAVAEGKVKQVPMGGGGMLGGGGPGGMPPGMGGGGAGMGLRQ